MNARATLQTLALVYILVLGGMMCFAQAFPGLSRGALVGVLPFVVLGVVSYVMLTRADK